MALTEVMKMKGSDLEFLVEQHNGALGSTGTGSGTGDDGGGPITFCCDVVTVHCCFAAPSVMQIQVAELSESPSGYKLVVDNGCEFAIGLE